MFRSRTENLRSVYVLLFLNVAFFLIEQQDAGKYATTFAFDRDAVASGEVWRLVTYQFTQSGKGFMEAISLFFTLLLLYIMGSALEEEWGTRHFLTLFALSTFGSAGIAAILGVPLLGTYFVYYTLLFVYASTFPRQTFHLFAIIPIRVTLLAMFSLAILLFGAFAGGWSNVAALGGAASGYGYFLAQRRRVVFTKGAAEEPVEIMPAQSGETAAIHNAAVYGAIREALTSSSVSEIDSLLARCDRDKVPGVNICPPADYKPEGADGYCIRCEGFAECSARYLRANRADDAAGDLKFAAPDASS
jgi:membrane associated rhomboid family serine protease